MLRWFNYPFPVFISEYFNGQVNRNEDSRVSGLELVLDTLECVEYVLKSME
jgi:hypothetical protein